MQVRVLGRVELRNDDDELIFVRQRKLRQLVCVLALTCEPVPSEQLQSMLWAVTETQNMLSALTTTVNKLRNLLPEGRIGKDHAGYRLVLHGGDYLDVREFRARVAEACGVRESDPHRAADLYQRAVDTWIDPHLPDLPDTPAATARARQLFIERRDAIEALVEVRMALGQHAAVARELPALLVDDALNDRLWLSLLLAQYRDGRKGDALRTFEEARGTYVTKTGAEPSVSLKTMRDRIAHDDLELRWRPEQTVREKRAVNAGIDITIASSARAYDYLLGGADNFEVDRQAADRLLTVVPDLREVARRNRAFLLRTVRFLSRRGIRQFLDIGTGLPTQGSVHEVAREITPGARVVYVDNDPMVVAHANAIIDDRRNTAVIFGDLKEPAKILDHPETRRLIDPEEPVAVLMLAILHFIAADAVHLALEHYRAWMAPGSALAITHMTRTGTGHDVIRAMETAAPHSAVEGLFLRSRPEIEALFTGLRLAAPLNDLGCPLACELSLAILGGVAFRV
ncbi:MAG: SAM-dependent methyltransferase [Actinomadura sp.]